MKVLHFSSARTWRGGEQQIAYLIDELLKNDIQQIVYCPNNSALHQYCLQEKINCYTYRKIASINPFPGIQLQGIVKKESVHLIHLHDAHAHTFACLGALWTNNPVPMILSRRVMVPIKKNRFSQWKYRHPSIKAILCVSAFVKKILEVELPNDHRLKVIPSGVDLHKMSQATTHDLHQEWSIPPQNQIIANIAAIGAFKDYFTFVDTAEILLQKRPQLTFLIIGGDGGETAAIKAYVQEKGLSQAILFTGFRKDIPAILPAIDVLLFTSKMEGLGTSLLDAFAARVPVVATDAGGIPEIVIDEKTGLLAPVGDAAQLARQVLRLLNTPALRAQVLEAAKIHLQQFSKAKMALNTLAVYRKVCSVG
ncbi:MAG: glycosyltransferase family 4 protein [Bacteroidota bacterium]